MVKGLIKIRVPEKGILCLDITTEFTLIEKTAQSIAKRELKKMGLEGTVISFQSL